MREAGAFVLHLLPVDLSRGAQAYARVLREALDGYDQHRTMTLFQSAPAALRPDLTLNVPLGLRRFGFDPRAAVRLRRVLGRLRPHVLVAHGGEALKYAAVVDRSETRLVYYAIGLASDRLRNPARKAAYRVLVGRADAVAAVSDETAVEARDLFGVEPSRVSLVPNGRDHRHYRPRDDRTNRGALKVAFVGHVTPTKRPAWFVETVRALRQRGVSLDAVLVGDGPALDAVRHIAAGAGVRLLGRRDDVADILADSDLFLFTSMGECEGMPGVLIEAGLCGVPVVTTDVSGARTVVDHGVTGLVVPVDDPSAMIDAAHRLAVDDDLRSRMAGAARQRCETRFSMEASVDEWRGLIDGVLGRGGGEPHSIDPRHDGPIRSSPPSRTMTRS